MSDTPRTDSQLLTVKDCSYVAPHPTGEYVHADFARELERENAALREDRERLNWLSNSLGWVIVGYPEADPTNYATDDNTLADAWRAAIDAARAKEAKP